MRNAPLLIRRTVSTGGTRVIQHEEYRGIGVWFWDPKAVEVAYQQSLVNLKARLAYSTVSQLSYVTLGAMLATKYGILGGGTQIAAHALGKMTLFMCAGAIATAAHKKYISDMRGLGRVMPFTFVAYIIGACSIIGLPPLAGTWPKFFLMLGSVETGDLVLIIVLIISSLLNIVYLLPPAIRAFMDPAPAGQPEGLHEAPAACLVPAWFTAIGCLVLFFLMSDLVRYLEPLVEGL